MYNATILFDRHSEEPWRADLLYDLSRHYRFKGMPATALEFALQGRGLPWPEGPDHLLARYGIESEIATLGWYSSRAHIRELGHQYSEALALDRDFPRAAQDVAWRNAFSYTKRLADLAPSLRKERIEFAPPDGFYPLNPSICRHQGGMIMNVRAVNYRIGVGERLEGPCITRNFLFQVGHDLSKQDLIDEIKMPIGFPEYHSECLGFEDLRLWPNEHDLWCSATIRQHNAAGWCQIVIARINKFLRFANWGIMLPTRERHEKNWMPVIGSKELTLIYSVDPTVLVTGKHDSYYGGHPKISAHHWRGSSQAIPFQDGYLAIVHERPLDRDPVLYKPPYRQRFVWFDHSLVLRKWSYGWEFGHDSAGEFVCGMCEHPDGQRLVISYGVLDREAWLATVDKDEVWPLLRNNP